MSNVHSLLNIKNDKVVYELYFRGKDQRHGKKLGIIDHSADMMKFGFFISMKETGTVNRS